MNLASVDLNLLVAFEALMEERHVTRAGQRIGLAQPSMSSTLTRLRALFGDELFVRSASGMQPTAKALALARPISDALGRSGACLNPHRPSIRQQPAIACPLRRPTMATSSWCRDWSRRCGGRRLVSISWCAPSLIRPRVSRAWNTAMSTR
ncbi:LysR family transcriptional regulator [Bradyrhizobium japonicum]